MTRSVLRLLHRYVGLATAGFLFLAGVTGSIITFHGELDAWLNPSLFSASIGRSLPPSVLAGKVEASDPRIQVAFVELNVAAGRSATIYVEPKQGMPDADYNQVFVDPVTGGLLGRRAYGSCCFSREALIPFLYNFHRRLAMPGHWGEWLMGGVAVLWLFDCFVAFALSVPRRWRVAKQWKTVLSVKTGASSFRTTFDLHRAGGLWFWAVLGVLAMSSIYLNLGEIVFRPVVGVFAPLTPSPYDGRPQQTVGASKSFDDIQAVAESFAAEFDPKYVVAGIYRDKAAGIYIVDFDTESEFKFSQPWAAFDAVSGKVVSTQIPGRRTAGDAFIQLQFPLHSGRIGGLPGRILICIAGIVVAMLAVTGVIIWWRKRAR